jgi:hypothetical protein
VIWILIVTFLLITQLFVLALLRTTRSSDRGADRMLGSQSADR